VLIRDANARQGRAVNTAARIAKRLERRSKFNASADTRVFDDSVVSGATWRFAAMPRE